MYSISAGAGNVTIILAERCSVTPLECLCLCEKVSDADDPKAAKKVAVAVEALIQKHRTQESYTRIKNVM
jgi:hypothetical protein